jgi:RNA polymerase sigma-70 factor (ECF subfamily)
VARAAGRWQPNPERARFRTWLNRVALNLLADHFRLRARQHVPTQPDEMDETESPRAAELARDFEVEYRRALFHRAAELVRSRVSETTWRAFELTAVDEVPAASVSQQLGLSIGSVYVARSRTMQLLRQEIEALESQNNL